MIWLLAVIAYVVIGTLNAFRGEVWWREYLGRPRRTTWHSFECERCNAHISPWCHRDKCNGMGRLTIPNREVSTWLAVLLSGFLWPLFPFVKCCLRIWEKADKDLTKRKEREAEIKEAEKEL